MLLILFVEGMYTAEYVKQDIPVEQVVYDSSKPNDYDMEEEYENHIKTFTVRSFCFVEGTFWLGRTSGRKTALVENWRIRSW